MTSQLDLIENLALRPGFEPVESYRTPGYDLLPFKFLRMADQQVVITNMAGEHRFLSRDELVQVIEGRLDAQSSLFHDLVSQHFIAEKNSKVHLDLLATKVRTKLARISEFTSLHLFVVTLRCNHTCSYCQVSRVSEDRQAFDMTPETALLAIDAMFRSPSRYLKVEFQGGESLLNFPIIKFIVEETKKRNDGRDIQFVIATNLAVLSDEMLDYAEANSIFFSTSLDGPESLHNFNRSNRGANSHAQTLEGIHRIRQRFGHDRVSALMTTSHESLKFPEQIVDEYVKQGFHEIFLRHINPYGFAAKQAATVDYASRQYLAFYQKGLEHILKLNQQGVRIREVYASLLLRRILTPFSDGYVDLQSPAGMGLMVIAYNYNGDVYSSDEGRMLAEMNDFTFRMGNLKTHSWKQLYSQSNLLPMLSESMVECTPGCADCAFSGWCGSNPVFHHRTQGHFTGYQPTSAFCDRNMTIIKYLLNRLRAGGPEAAILESWAH